MIFVQVYFNPFTFNRIYQENKSGRLDLPSIVSVDNLIYRMYLDRQAWANSVDPDETLQIAAFHQGLHYLSLTQQYLDTKSGNKSGQLKPFGIHQRHVMWY